MIHGESVADALAYFGGGNAQGPTAQGSQAERFHGVKMGCARAGNHDELDEIRQEVGITPLGQGGHMIGTDEPGQAGVWETRGTGADGVDGVAGAAPMEFQVIDLELGMPGQGDAQPAEAEGVRGRGVGRFEGGTRGGDEDDAVELKFLAGRFSHEEMAEMDWVEGTAVETNAHGGNQQQRWMPSKRFPVVST